MYNNYLDKLKEKYPDIYLKLIDFPDATIIGIFNEMLINKIDLNKKEQVITFFNNRIKLTRYLITM